MMAWRVRSGVLTKLNEHHLGNDCTYQRLPLTALPLNLYYSWRFLLPAVEPKTACSLPVSIYIE